MRAVAVVAVALLLLLSLSAEAWSPPSVVSPLKAAALAAREPQATPPPKDVTTPRYAAADTPLLKEAEADRVAPRAALYDRPPAQFFKPSRQPVVPGERIDSPFAMGGGWGGASTLVQRPTQTAAQPAVAAEARADASPAVAVERRAEKKPAVQRTHASALSGSQVASLIEREASRLAVRNAAVRQPLRRMLARHRQRKQQQQQRRTGSFLEIGETAVPDDVDGLVRAQRQHERRSQALADAKALLNGRGTADIRDKVDGFKRATSKVESEALDHHAQYLLEQWKARDALWQQKHPHMSLEPVPSVAMLRARIAAVGGGAPGRGDQDVGESAVLEQQPAEQPPPAADAEAARAAPTTAPSLLQQEAQNDLHETLLAGESDPALRAATEATLAQMPAELRDQWSAALQRNSGRALSVRQRQHSDSATAPALIQTGRIAGRTRPQYLPHNVPVPPQMTKRPQ